MTLDELLAHLDQAGVRLRLSNGRLKVTDKRKVLDDTLLAAIKSHREAIITLLADGLGHTRSDFRYALLDDQALSAIQKQYPLATRIYPATPMQSGLVFHGLRDGTGASYTIQTTFELDGPLDMRAFRRAWRHIIERHDILRTCFVGLDTEHVHQLVLSAVSLPFLEFDLRGLDPGQQRRRLDSFAAEDKAKGFDFASPPLLRICVSRLAESRFHVLWTRHHALLDGWSSPLVFTEVAMAYRAIAAGQAPSLGAVVPFEDYAAWLSRRDQGKAREYWREYLRGVVAPTPLVVDDMPNPHPGTGMRTRERTISGGTSDRLNALARRVSCTMNAIVQAVWACLLRWYSGEATVVFGSTVSGRPEDLPGVERMMGLFINTLPVRVELHDAMTIGALLASLHADNATRIEHGYLALPDICRQTSVPAGMPVFDSLLIFENYPVPPESLELANGDGELKIASGRTEEGTNYTFSLGAHYQRQLGLLLGYPAETVADETADRVLAHLSGML
jgi:hypothetical protein